MHEAQTNRRYGGPPAVEYESDCETCGGNGAIWLGGGDPDWCPACGGCGSDWLPAHDEDAPWA